MLVTEAETSRNKSNFHSHLNKGLKNGKPEASYGQVKWVLKGHPFFLLLTE